MLHQQPPHEGDIYKVLTVGGKEYVLRYGYYSEADREEGILIPLLPDFYASPEYTPEGYALATRVQDACPHYRSKNGKSGENWCADCIYYPSTTDEIAVCQSENTRKPKGGHTP